MAARGFAAAYIGFLATPTAGGSNRPRRRARDADAVRRIIGLTGLAEAVFTYPARDGQDRGALSPLRPRPHDCWPALHGISLGGLRVGRAARRPA